MFVPLRLLHLLLLSALLLNSRHFRPCFNVCAPNPVDRIIADQTQSPSIGWSDNFRLILHFIDFTQPITSR